MHTQQPRYVEQASSQTLAEAIDEYYTINDFLLDPGELGAEVADLFKAHDAGHVIFGCDTSIRGEALIDTWTVMGTDAGMKGYMEYFKHPEVNNIFAETGAWKITVESARCLPDIVRVLIASRRMTAKWPWFSYETYLNTPLADIREQYNIRVV